jgi:dTDP-4-amino-4,6-dideoxygalactose transaminase
MYRVGQKEIDAVAKVLTSGRVFRYFKKSECDRFERRYAKFLGVKHVLMTASGTNAITAGLIGLGIGPGDEVIVPACTYMATAVGVLAVGAIPIIVDVDESTTIDPKAIERNIGPQTRAIIPVHMWGLPCDMDRIMKIARRHKLWVLEDACQGVGGAYKGRMLGSIGHVGAFSFNYYKNMTAGEGGAVATDSERFYQRSRCAVDCCDYYWKGRETWGEHFISNGSRASEIEGAILNVQLDRIRGMIGSLRRQKKRVLRETADTGIQPIRANSLDWECGSTVAFLLPTAAQAQKFVELAGGTIMRNTGRHVYTEWDPIFAGKGAHHDAVNPFKLKENRPCRKTYTKEMCARSLDILGRTVMMGLHPDNDRAKVTGLIGKIRNAAKAVLAG